MLNEKELRALILCRVLAANDQCNSHYINHAQGQFRALLAVLTGECPPNVDIDSPMAILDAAGIPYRYDKDTEMCWFEKDWLKEHGFEWDSEHDSWPPYHPRFSKSW